MKRLIVLLPMLTIFIAKPVVANDDRLHIAAHVGTSFALTTIAYGICRQSKIKRIQENAEDQIPCLMVSGFTALMVGFLYKHLERPTDIPRGWNRAMISNGAGVALGVSNIVLWNWK